MKKISLLMMILALLLSLAGCFILVTKPVAPKYSVSFNTMEGESLSDVVISSDEVPNFNETQIPIKAGHTFLGWYYDFGYQQRFDQETPLTSDLLLYAKWEVHLFNITFHDTLNDVSITRQVAYNEQAILEVFTHEGYELSYYYETNDLEPFDFDLGITRAYDLYTKWVVKSGYIRILFETNGGNDLDEHIILKDTLLSKPTTPIKGNSVFAGWYTNSDFTTIFDFETPVSTDITLYAKWISQVERDYEINEDTLSWNSQADALFYDVYLGKDAVDPISVTTNFIDLKPYEQTLLEKTLIEVYIVYETYESHLLFDLNVMYEDDALLYQTGFEGPKFPPSTTYNNNVTPKYVGDEGYKWFIINGSPSTRTPLAGEQSLQLRWYSSSTNTPSLEMDFTLSGVKKLEFKAKSADHDLKVLYEVDGVLNTNEVIFDLTGVTTHYEIMINQTGAVKIRFELVKVSNEIGRPVYIDDLVVYGFSLDKTLIEVVDEVTLPDEADLLALKNQFESDRSKLDAPTYLPLSVEGISNYYASLNGLTGNEFKTKLRQITSSNHERLISYGEARFVLELSDLVTKDSKTYLDGIYSGHEIVRYWDGGSTWAREHVWPNSRLATPRVGNSDKNIASDVHNLRAINPSVNSSRSNRYFTNGTSYGLVGSQMYYPGDQYKGDVARILFYMVTRYSDVLILRSTNIIDSAYTSEGAVMGLLDVLLTWHELDPVSEFEIHRNQVIYGYQGNRNPFIDRPEYVNVYFG